MKISSPVVYGSGAYIAHKSLESVINNYKVLPYSPYWEYVPPAISYFRDRSADLVHAPINYATFSRLPEKPLVSTFHGFVLDKYMYQFSSLFQKIHYQTDLKWLTLKGLKQSSIVTCVSKYLAEKIREELHYTGEIRTIYNGVDTNKFFPEGSKLKNETKVNVLFCGNPIRKKGADLIPEILNQLDAGIELIYTTGLNSNKVAIQHPRAFCVGSVSHDDMPLLYNKADILLFPTVREGFGLVVAEAMACGLPVVTTNCSSLPELVDDNKGGFLCATGDVKMFAEKITVLAESLQLRKEMGLYNRHKIQQLFTLDKMVIKYRHLFEEVLSQSC